MAAWKRRREEDTGVYYHRAEELSLMCNVSSNHKTKGKDVVRIARSREWRRIVNVRRQHRVFGQSRAEPLCVGERVGKLEGGLFVVVRIGRLHLHRSNCRHRAASVVPIEAVFS